MKTEETEAVADNYLCGEKKKKNLTINKTDRNMPREGAASKRVLMAETCVYS